MDFKLISIGESSYPSPLLALEDPPESLYLTGELPKDYSNFLAIVGSREMSGYGKTTAKLFSSSLSREGLTIVSGLMYGIDSVAHEASLSVGGKTVAVLGSGFNKIYPKSNEKLLKKIINSGGAVISEYPPDFSPQRWTFPKRNRIVAAISLKGTLVVEAGERSGSLITASYADALNRPLYAVPGSIYSPTSKGTNQMIRDNLAKAVTRPEDMLE